MLLSVFFGKNIHPRLPGAFFQRRTQNAPRQDGKARGLRSFRAAVTVLFLRLHFHQIGLVF